MSHVNFLATIAFFSAVFGGFFLMFNEMSLFRVFSGLFIVSWSLFKVALEIYQNEED